MKKQHIGLDKYLFTFTLAERELFIARFEAEQRKGGTVTQVFINNGYAFEVKRTVI